MGTKSCSNDATLRLRTMQPRFRWCTVAVFLLVIAMLGCVSFFKQGVQRVYYRGPYGAVPQRAHTPQQPFVAKGVVKDLRKPVNSRSRFLNFIFSRFSANIPLIKYSFVAFDEKTYVGETGWGVRGLYEGARITILYNSGNPAASHPLTSFLLLRLAINLMRTQCGSNALERAVTDSTD